jgi:Tfp pilus assembly protein PilF
MTESIKNGADDANRSWINKLDNFSNKVGVYRKILLNFSVIIVVLYLMIYLIATSFQKKLLVLPVDIPDRLKREGYTPELFTQKIIDRVEFMKSRASDYYDNNDIKLTIEDDKIEIVNGLLNNTPLEGFKTMFADFVNRNQEKVTGTVRDLKDSMQITFRLGDKQPFVVYKNGADSIIEATAEYILEESNPYFLSAYYFKSKQFDKCLQLVQKLLNSNDTKYKYLAFHIRGNVYVSLGYDLLNKDEDTSNDWLAYEYLSYAKNIIDSAIVTNTFKSPWLSYNTMGAVYQYRKDYDSAKIWYRRSMSANHSGANAFNNYARILLNEYKDDEITFKSYPDSAVVYFKEAIKRNPSKLTYYLGLLDAYACGENVEQAKVYFFKCKDMDPENLDIYALLSKAYRSKNPELAEKYNNLSRGMLDSALEDRIEIAW